MPLDCVQKDRSCISSSYNCVKMKKPSVFMIKLYRINDEAGNI